MRSRLSVDKFYEDGKAPEDEPLAKFPLKGEVPAPSSEPEAQRAAPGDSEERGQAAPLSV